MQEQPARAFQDDLGDIGFAHCWGCGSKNEHGLRIKSYWVGDEAVCTWQPEPYHVASPGIVSGGIIATIMDCHCAATACAAAYRAQGRPISAEDPLTYVTASLQVTYLRHTPSAAPVHLRARVTEMAGRKVTVACSLYSGEDECARAEVVAARVPNTWHAEQRG
jgi:acyl-coenzyme A thioesterase PaaI-like protein